MHNKIDNDTLNIGTLNLEEELINTKLLQSISTELIWKNNIQMLFERIVDTATQIMHSEYASLQILNINNIDADHLQLLAFRGFNEDAVRFWKHIDAKHASTTCGEALLRGHRIIVPNVNECEFMHGTEDLRVYLHTGIQAVQSTPLFSRNGSLLGMISTHWGRPYLPSESELRHFDVLARQAADLIELKQHQEKITWDKEKAEILYEVTEKLLASDNPQEIVEELCLGIMHFLKCDLFVNYLIFDDNMQLKLNACSGISDNIIKSIQYLNIGDAICGCVAKDGKRIVAERIQTVSDDRTRLVKSLGIKAYACHPLMEQNKVIGTLSFGTKSKDAFTDDELTLMKTFSNQVSIAMTRIRTEQLLRRQQQLMLESESEKRKALERSMDMKDDFLSLVSHELRTPINVINTAIQALNYMYADEMSDKVKDYIKTIRQNKMYPLSRTH